MKKIIILHVFVTLPVGGAEQLLLSTVKNLDKNKVQSIICCIRDKGEIGEKLERLGFQVIALNKLYKTGWDGSIVDSICDAIERSNIDLIHSHLYHANLYSRFAARRAKVPAIVSIHNTYSKQKKIHRRLINWYLTKYTSAIIVGSQDIKRDVMRYDRVPDTLIHTIRNSVDLSSVNTTFDRETARINLNLCKNDFVLGTIGRLEEQKGHCFLIDAIAILNKNKFYPKLLVVGDGRLRNELEVQVQKFMLESQVTFLGTRNDLGDIFPAIDLFVMPSLWEGLSLSMLTAMAARLPVIATDVGGVKDVLGCSDGLVVVRPRDSQGLAEAILKMRDNKELMEEYSLKGQMIVRNKFSDLSMTRSIYSLYVKTIKSYN